jgi:hypothetical protein
MEHSKVKYNKAKEDQAKKVAKGYKCHCDEPDEFAFDRSEPEEKIDGHVSNCIFSSHNNYKWHLSPTQKYTLSSTAKIYHFCSAEDYQTAVGKYPGYEHGSYFKDSFSNEDFNPSVYYHLVKQRETFFLAPMKKIEYTLLSSGYTKKDLDSIKPNSVGPYIYYEYRGYNNKVHIPSFGDCETYANIETYRVKKSRYNKPVKAYAQLKYHASRLEEMIQEYHKGLLDSVEPDCIDYDAMRDDGYDGFRIHAEALIEAKERSKAIESENEALRNEARSKQGKKKFMSDFKSKKDIYSVVSWWEADSLCVWNWCFE